MKKRKKKKSPAKKPARSAKQKPASASTAKAGKRTLVNKQPQVKQQAAVAHGMFLYTDDAWSLQYFDPNDLHFKEREVFG
jgi:hypothetical protein